MNEFEDYYMILQLHHLAEPEVVEGAYKKLAKKYHPDVNKTQSAGEKMKLINRAYEELRDPVRRQAYDLKLRGTRAPRNPVERAYSPPQPKYEAPPAACVGAKAALDSYFKNIMDNRFDAAYLLASGIDKHNITCADFITWQRAVASVFHLKKYGCQLHRAHKNKLLNGRVAQEAVEFSVEVVEYNVVMNRDERDSFLKTVVLENGEWRVFIGYETLQPMIDRFKELTDLLAAKSVMNEFIKQYSKIDTPTGLVNRAGLSERIESEIFRFDRYRHGFSLLMIQADVQKSPRREIDREVGDAAVKAVAEVARANLRKIDVLGRWSETVLLALLPETAGAGAARAAKKLLDKLKNHTFAHNGRLFSTAVNIQAAEYASSLKQTLDRLNRLLG